jgi:glutamate synthase domain-containing protein 3
VITPSRNDESYVNERNSIIGNCALYGATGGSLFVYGSAGDRFAVRNSGAVTVVESIGFHGCEYMSGGLVWILGQTKGNIGAGLSGGEIYLRPENIRHLNLEYVRQVPIQSEDEIKLRKIGEQYLNETDSKTMSDILSKEIRKEFIKLMPKKS